MKKLIIVLIVFMQFGCDPEEKHTITRVIKNVSPYNVVMEGYNNGKANLSSLPSGDSVVASEECISERGQFKCDIQFIGYDSVRLIFDNEKIEVFCSGLFLECINERKDIMEFNVFDENSPGGYVEGPKYTFTYTITEEDYQNAEPLEN